MLPTADAIWVGGELHRRFGLPFWQMAMTRPTPTGSSSASPVRSPGGRRCSVFDWCYHGTVDEALATLDADGASSRGRLDRAAGRSRADDRRGALQRRRAPGAGARRRGRGLRAGRAGAHEHRHRAARAGYHDALRRLTRATGTLLVIDETHTICAGPGGCTRAWELDPDAVVVGKTIGGGVPAAAYGLSTEVADRLRGPLFADDVDVSGVGGTLTGNALAIAAVKATLSTALTDDDFARTIPLAVRWTDGVQAAIDAHQLPWTVQRLGCRAEYWFCPAPHDGAQAAAAVDPQLDGFMHLWALNRGILLTPFHNMALLSPHHDADDVDLHTEVFAAAVEQLVA
jgi:glutamate-1-semialdehyde 2,1-aminomutase